LEGTTANPCLRVKGDDLAVAVAALLQLTIL
jgi:hypothetical protein